MTLFMFPRQLIKSELRRRKTHQIYDNGFNLTLNHLDVFGRTLKGDLVLSLGELDVHLCGQDEDHKEKTFPLGLKPKIFLMAT